MRLFSRFFGQEQAAPMGMADPAADNGVAARLAGIEFMPDGLPLRQLAGLSPSAGDAPGAMDASMRDARLRVARLIDEGVIDVQSLMAQSPDPLAVLSLVTLCKNTVRWPAALAALNDASQVVALVTGGASSRLRQLAAETIENPEQLRQLIRQVRDKDKGVYKILKQKSDALLAAERTQTELMAEVDAVTGALERHSQRSFDSSYDSTLEHLSARWQALAARVPEEVGQRAGAFLQRCERVVAEHAELAARLQAQHAAERALQDAVRDTEQRSREEALAAAAVLRESEAMARLEAAAQRAATHAAEQAELTARQLAERELYRQLDGMLRKTHAVLNEGDTKRASTLRRSLDEKLSAVPNLPAPLARQLQQLDAKLQELKHWKDFAVAPKRAELIAEMESLIGVEEDPKLLAERIRALQDDWRTVGKGIVGDAPAETDRFHRASQLAFQPCRAYFEAQAQLRRENLEQRKALLERLAGFAATQTPENFDWRLVTQALREAPQEWRRSFPVEREAGRALQEDFDSRIKHLKSMLAAWYDGNVAEKQALIEQARGLLDRTDSRDAIDAMKHVQTRWKETKPAPREQDQSLWTEFRDACDAVYRKRQQAHIEHVASLETNKSAVIALCENVEGEEGEAAASLAGPDLAAAVARWRANFAAAGELPRGEARSLEDRFERALEACKARVANQRVLEGRQADADLTEAGRLIQACQWAAAGAAPAEEQTVLRKAAQAFIDGVSRWPKGALPVLKEVLAKAHETTLGDVAVREKALRMLCIRCEILAGMTTPPEDQTLRREYQVHRLTQSMGQGSRMEEISVPSVMLEWVRVAAIAPQVHAPLQERFSRCVARLKLLRSA